MKNSFAIRTGAVAALAGLSLSLGAPAIIAPIAGAQEAPAGSPIVNAGAKGTLTIHKRANPTQMGTPTGNADANVSGDPLAGVGFTIYKVNGIDLTTNAGLVAAANLDVASYLTAGGAADTTKVTAIGNGQQTTDSNGEISYSDLELGVYLVLETSPLAGYTPSAPFLAFVPMTTGNGGAGAPDAGQGASWTYDVHAYPKNYNQNEPEKEVVDHNQQAGQVITYTVTGKPRTLAEGSDRTIFRIEDTLDDKLTPPALGDVKVVATGADGQAINIEGKYEVKVEGQKVTVNFTDASVLPNGSTVKATIPATVKADASTRTTADNGTVVNKAQVFENKPGSEEEDKPKDTPEVKTHYGNLEFTKVSGKTREALAGASFQVYGAYQDQQCSAVVSAQDRLITAINGAGDKTNTFTSDASGKVRVSGLHVNVFADNQDVTTGEGEGANAQYDKYCLVEKKAPQGYELLAQPIEFKLTTAGETYRPTVGSTTGEVENLPDSTPKLPSTGGNGVGLLAGIGALIAGAGAYFTRRNAKAQA